MVLPDPEWPESTFSHENCLNHSLITKAIKRRSTFGVNRDTTSLALIKIKHPPITGSKSPIFYKPGPPSNRQWLSFMANSYQPMARLIYGMTLPPAVKEAISII